MKYEYLRHSSGRCGGSNFLKCPSRRTHRRSRRSSGFSFRDSIRSLYFAESISTSLPKLPKIEVAPLGAIIKTLQGCSLLLQILLNLRDDTDTLPGNDGINMIKKSQILFFWMIST